MTRIVALLCALAVPGLAQATEARKTALARSWLHVDDADIFLYPGMVGGATRFVFVDAYASADDADGGIFLGTGPVFGAVFNHRPLWDDIGEMDALYSVDVPFGVHHVADVALAFPSGDSAWGLMLGWGTGLVDAAGEDPANSGDFLSTGGSANVVDLGVGWSQWIEGATRIDIGFGVTENLFELVDAGDTTVRMTKTPGIHVAGRFLIPMNARLDVGIEGLVSRRDYGVEIVAGGVDGSYSGLIGRVSVGPRIHPSERVTIGFFGRLRLERVSGQIEDQDGPTLTSIGIPGAGAALEFAPTEHVTMRIGGDYEHSFQRVSLNPPGPGNDSKFSATADAATWGFGLGYARDAYRLDAAMTGNFDFGATAGTQVVLAGSYLFQ